MCILFDYRLSFYQNYMPMFVFRPVWVMTIFLYFVIVCSNEEYPYFIFQTAIRIFVHIFYYLLLFFAVYFRVFPCCVPVLLLLMVKTICTTIGSCLSWVILKSSLSISIQCNNYFLLFFRSLFQGHSGFRIVMASLLFCCWYFIISVVI